MIEDAFTTEDNRQKLKEESSNNTSPIREREEEANQISTKQPQQERFCGIETCKAKLPANQYYKFRNCQKCHDKWAQERDVDKKSSEKSKKPYVRNNNTQVQKYSEEREEKEREREEIEEKETE